MVVIRSRYKGAQGKKVALSKPKRKTPILLHKMAFQRFWSLLTVNKSYKAKLSTREKKSVSKRSV